MTRRTKWFAGGVVAVVAVGVAVAVWVEWRGTDRGRFAQIQAGMSRAEVWETMGRPPYNRYRGAVQLTPPGSVVQVGNLDTEQWHDYGVSFTVTYDYDTERVTDAATLERFPTSTSARFLAGLRARLGL